MIPADFIAFFAASLTADGALVGLLFVAIAIEPERTFGPDSQERELAANGAFTGLVNAFLISMFALIPRINIGWAVIIVAGLSFLNTIAHSADKLRRGHKTYTRSVVYTIGALLIYGLQMFYGVQLIQQPGDIGVVYSLIVLLIAQYGIALARAWTLLGSDRRTIFGVLMDGIRRRTSQPQAVEDDKKTAPPV